MNTTKNQKRTQSMDTDSLDNLYGGFLECAKEDKPKELKEYLEEATYFNRNP